MSNYAFFLNSYNDVDNIVPVIYKFLENGESSLIIFNEKFDYKSDYRINHLQKKFGNKVIIFNDTNPSIGKNLRRLMYIFGKFTSYEQYLKKYNVSTCVFEWNVYYNSTTHGMFFVAAKRLGIPTIALPHGVNIFTNHDVTKSLRDFNNKTGKFPQSYMMKDIDLCVETNLITHQFHRLIGISTNIEVWGSARYDPKWSETNLKICPKFTAKNSTKGKIKVVFMLPHWNYNVDKTNTIALLKELAKISWIYMVIKDHTRGDGGLDEQFRTKINSMPNIESSKSAQSPALVQWSDVVICFGSSIGIEAILQDKILVNPFYLHTNQTVYDETASAYSPRNSQELFEILNEIKNDQIESIPMVNKELLLNEVVYGGRKKYDVLEYYYENISKFTRRKNISNHPPHQIIIVWYTLLRFLRSKLNI